mgnify:FL=1|jgi:hypothetical protein
MRFADAATGTERGALETNIAPELPWAYPDVIGKGP